MNINVYLPDDLGKQAKEAELPLSRLLQEAARDELERRATMASTLTKSQTHELALEDADGGSYTGRITGVLVAVSDRTEDQLYLTEQENLVFYDVKRQKYVVIDDIEELRDDPDMYIAAAHAIGEAPVIDLDV